MTDVSPSDPVMELQLYKIMLRYRNTYEEKIKGFVQVKALKNKNVIDIIYLIEREKIRINNS